MRQQRRGESALETIGGIVIILAIVGGAFLLFTQGGCDRVEKELATKPDMKIINKGYEFNLLADNECWAEARNTGAAGNVTFTFKDDAGYKHTYHTYFDRDEKRTVRFTLPGESSLNGKKWGLSVAAD